MTTDTYTYIQYGKYFSWQRDRKPDQLLIFFGLTNVHENRITIAGWSASTINFMTLKFDEGNIFDVEFQFNDCYVGASIDDQYYLTRRIFRDSNHIYLMRNQIEVWNSTFNMSFSEAHFQNRLLRRSVVDKPKIQIFTLEYKGGCKIQEITSESLGLNEEIKDFNIFIRDNTTFVFILTNTQVIVFKAINQSSRFSTQLNRPFVKIDVRYDMLLLVSEQDNSEVYNIIWQTFPLAGTLELNFTLIHVQETSDIVGGLIMQKGVIIATKLSLILYIFEAKNTLYSIETRNIQEFQPDYQWTFVDDIQYKDNSTILLQYHISYSRFQTLEVNVYFQLNVSKYEWLRVENEKEVKEYKRNPIWKKTENKENLLSYE